MPFSMWTMRCTYNTAQKMKFSIEDLLSKYDQISSLLRIWSHLLKKSLMENFIFLQCNEAVRKKKFASLEVNSVEIVK